MCSLCIVRAGHLMLSDDCASVRCPKCKPTAGHTNYTPFRQKCFPVGPSSSDQVHHPISRLGHYLGFEDAYLKIIVRRLPAHVVSAPGYDSSRHMLTVGATADRQIRPGDRFIGRLSVQCGVLEELPGIYHGDPRQSSRPIFGPERSGWQMRAGPTEPLNGRHGPH